MATSGASSEASTAPEAVSEAPRQPWHSANGDKHIRMITTRRIARLLHLNCPRQTEQYRRKIPLLSMMVEKSFYNTAPSMSAYKDSRTLRTRLRRLRSTAKPIAPSPAAASVPLPSTADPSPATPYSVASSSRQAAKIPLLTTTQDVVKPVITTLTKGQDPLGVEPVTPVITTILFYLSLFTSPHSQYSAGAGAKQSQTCCSTPRTFPSSCNPRPNLL